MIEYRLANASDADELARIRIKFLAEDMDLGNEEQQAVLYENNRRYMAESISDGSFLAWLAVEDGEIIATSGMSFYTLPPNPFSPTGKAAYISNMFTRPDYRKQGIATELLSLLIADAKELGYARVSLNASDMGRLVYERYGFKDAVNSMGYAIV